jgi:hypothetical protein
MVLTEILMKPFGKEIAQLPGTFFRISNQQLVVKKWYFFEEECQTT